MIHQLSYFNNRLRLDDAVELSLSSLRAYGSRYAHWSLAYSGGKDSTAMVTFVLWAIRAGLVSPPSSLTVLYADTRMELPPLADTAMQLLYRLQADGLDARAVLPPIDRRFFVYMLGRGVPPPKNRFRWCTVQLKVTPMMAALSKLREQVGQKLLSLTGVRIGESAARDRRIALSCSRNGGECGQGWYQSATPSAVADTLAPLLHWRLCHVYDWLYLDDRPGYDVSGIATVYGDGDVRTGCVGCNLASRDVALERLIRMPEWAHLEPLRELRPLYRDLQKPRWRKRKLLPEQLVGGGWGKNAQRMGPLTMEGREYGLSRVLDIQRRADIDLVNASEESRIRAMWSADVWPRKWSAADVSAALPIDAIRVVGEDLGIQPLLI